MPRLSQLEGAGVLLYTLYANLFSPQHPLPVAEEICCSQTKDRVQLQLALPQQIACSALIGRKERGNMTCVPGAKYSPRALPAFQARLETSEDQEFSLSQNHQFWQVSAFSQVLLKYHFHPGASFIELFCRICVILFCPFATENFYQFPENVILFFFWSLLVSFNSVFSHSLFSHVGSPRNSFFLKHR